MCKSTVYPVAGVARDRFVLERRRPRAVHDAWRYQDLIVEDELSDEGNVAPVATILLTGRECPWRCVMCDLWKYTTSSDTPRGALEAQITAARRELNRRNHRVTRIKLYNAGSFFDPHAVPEDDYAAIAAQLNGLERVIVESHSALIGPRVDRFLTELAREGANRSRPRLEVAMGLETVHPEALEALHKHMTRDDFAHAADALIRRDVALRVFLLVSPPFIPANEQDFWLVESIRVALAAGATAVSLVPTRSGNGALDALATEGRFRPPDLVDIERSMDLGLDTISHNSIGPSSKRLFIDLWDLHRFSSCSICFESRRARLHRMNLTQRVLPPVACTACGTRQPS